MGEIEQVTLTLIREEWRLPLDASSGDMTSAIMAARARYRTHLGSQDDSAYDHEIRVKATDEHLVVYFTITEP